MLKEVRINEQNTSLFEVVEKEGESSDTEPIIRKRVIKTHQYMNNILSKSTGGDRITPKNCRFVQNRGNIVNFVIEEDPKLRPIRFHYDFSRELANIKTEGVMDYSKIKKMTSNDINILKLMYPYTVFVMSMKEYKDSWEIRSFRVFFRIHPIKRMNDYLFCANALNLSNRSDLCFGGSVNLTKGKELTDVVDAVERVVKQYWIRPFTSEYLYQHKKYEKTNILKNFLTWAYYSEKDPMFIYSAKWILHERNITQELSAMSMETDGNLTKTKFSNLFVDSVTPESADSGNYSFDNMKLLTRILSVGDQLHYANADLYVYNLVGNRNGPTHIVFTDKEGNEVEPVKITAALKTDWDNQIEKQLVNYVDQIDLAGSIVKKGDIVKIVSTNTYEIVNKIRITRDSMVELECNNRFFLAKEGNIKVIKSVDANGIELIPNKDYIVCNNQFQHGYVGKMIKLETGSNNLLTIFFRDTVTNRDNGISMGALEEEDVAVFPADDNKIQPLRTFRYMDKLYTNDDSRYLFIKGRGLYDRQGNESDTFRHQLNSSSAISDILSEDLTELTIPGIDRDVCFRVGEKIVIGDWDNPAELMFKIREIVGFETTTESLKIKTRDSNGTILEIDYINWQTGIIKIGYIRKVASELNGIPVGSIITANQAGINNFPKKDRNKIAAFIIDADEPLILFHNGLTMWFNDLEGKFDILLPETQAHKRIRKFREFNPTEIGWQSGDLCVHDGKHYLLNNDNPYMGVVYMEIHPDFVKTGSLRSRARVSSSIDESFKRFGIIDPRYLKKDSEVKYELIPNFHNGAYKVPFDGYYPYTVRRTS